MATRLWRDTDTVLPLPNVSGPPFHGRSGVEGHSASSGAVDELPLSFYLSHHLFSTVLLYLYIAPYIIHGWHFQANSHLKYGTKIYCTYSITMGYKGQKFGRKKAPFGHICPSTFPQGVACLLRRHFIRCGNCPDTLQVCQFPLSVLCQYPTKHTHTHAHIHTSEFHPLFSSQPHSDCIHPFLFIRVHLQMLRMFV